MKTMVIIDGSAVLTTQYYGNLPDMLKYAKDESQKLFMQPLIRHNKNGVFTNAIYGTLNTIFRILRDQKPDYLAVVLDRSRNTFRKELYPKYKENRSPKPAPLKDQFELLKTILQEIGICVLDSEEYEADDLAGSIIKRFESEEIHTAFLTKDHDYLQLVNAYTSGYMLQTNMGQVEQYYGGFPNIPKDIPYKTILFTPQTVQDVEHVRPEQIPDLKGIAGDTSDNIPGVKGVSSAAARLLAKYQTMEDIYAAIDACSGDPKQEKNLEAIWKQELGTRGGLIKHFKESRDTALLSKRLATIVTDAPVPTALEDYLVKIDTTRALKLIEEYDLGELKEGYPVLLGIKDPAVNEWI